MMFVMCQIRASTAAHPCPDCLTNTHYANRGANSRRIARHGKLAWLTGTAMPIDPIAKRLLAMVAAGAPAERRRPTAGERRQALAKLMQFARSDAVGVKTTDGTLPGPGGEIAYRLYAPERDDAP